MIDSEKLWNELVQLPLRLSSHLMLAVVALSIGIAISLPLAIFLVRQKRFRYPVLTISGVIQTIPSLALLALMVPLLVQVGKLTLQLFGAPVPVLGFLPAVIALTLYSTLPILRNTITGILGVDANLTEAARGVGMTDRQILTKIELPLAAPVILAGIRTSTVWVVGTATLATPVGQRTLGDYIFGGLQTQNWTAVMVGCVAAASLAVILDFLLGMLETATSDRRRGLGILALVLLGIVFGGGVIGPTVLERLKERSGSNTLTIGAKTFTEQFILVRLIERRLDDAENESSPIFYQRKENLGSVQAFEALTRSDIDIFVDYSGTIWANYMKRTDTSDPDTVNNAVTDWLKEEHGVTMLGTLGFDNSYALAMRREQAEQLGIDSIDDLVPYLSELSIGGDFEFFERPEWTSIVETYGFDVERLRTQSYQSTFMYEAVARGAVDIISAFTTDGRIEANDLVLLADPKQAIPPYDAMLLLSVEATERPEVIDALKPLVGGIDNAMMRSANALVDLPESKLSPSAAARELDSWLR